MTGNISYMSEYEPYNRGYALFGHGGGMITGKGTIKTGKLEFENVYFVKELKYNLFSVSQICDNKNSVLFTDSECIVLGKDFKLVDDTHVLLRTPTQQNMYSIDLKNIIPHKNLTCLIAKASEDEKNLKDLKVKIIRCDNGGEFRNKEIDELCSRKGIKREFSNARTPQQNGVAEKRNRTLIEAVRTMLDDENQPIEKGTGPNWLFDIDSLTKSMNYVPVVVAGTSSTNISGTKEDALKENASSLRYIYLLNWFYEAQMATSNDSTRNRDAFSEKAKQVEPVLSSTVETEVPAVCTPVPTKCLSIPPVSSSGSRIISRGGSSYPEAPSLGNAMSFENRLEDFFGDTTDSVSSDKVEADLSNMETDIQISPTPTLRIHKVHPKSQIIGPVDTPVQTRQKTKNMEEQSFIATIHQKTNPELLQYCLFSCFLSQEEPKKIFDALKDPSWVEAMQEELLQFKIQNVWVLVDCPNGLCKEFEILMHDKFQMSAIGELNFFLGLQVSQRKNSIFLSQDKYIGDIHKKFGYTDVRTAKTPMDKENPWGKDGPGKDVDLHLYRSMIGSLMYLTASRPDIIFVVCVCARHQVTPKECHLHAVKRIFSDYDGENQDRKSTTGGCQFLRRRLISWQCKKQAIVDTSITKAEYVAAASCCGQVLWIQNQLLDYGYNFMNTKIYIDNNSAICIVKNPVYHSRTKHIDIRHHFIRDCYEKKLINVDHIHTDENVADLLTKPFDVGRMDLVEIHSLVMKRFATTILEGIDLLLWGDLRIILEDGTEINMLAERRYPLTKDTLDRMLDLRLTTISDDDAVFDLLRFIEKQIAELEKFEGNDGDRKDL
ncbi:putative ribonuclease H-like domain-containing protein [Tanacetum coccineum]